MSLMFPGLPPEQANTAWLNSPTRLTSCSRHERIGPTKSLSLLCQMVAKRVGPEPHASNTMSASLRPVWGRALRSLLTFTTRATFDNNLGFSSGSPVSGSTGPGIVVVVAASVVVGASVVEVVVLDDVLVLAAVVSVLVVADDFDPLHALASAAPPARVTN